MSPVERLRAATADAHRGLDAALDPVARLGAAPTRIAMLRGYHALHAGAEAAMAPFLADLAGLQFPARQRTPLIAAGLRAFGAAPAHGFTLPALQSPAAALGMLYVVEGSTLGGRTILRALRTTGADLAGLGFLDPYGPHTGAMWRAALAIIDRELAGDPSALDQAIAGAQRGFAYARCCLGVDQAAPVIAA